MRIIYGITIIIYCMLVIILHTLLYIKNKSKQGRKGKSANGTEEREEQGKGCRRHPRQFLASLPFRLLSSPSAPCPALGDAVATASLQIRQQATGGQASGLSVILPPLPLPQVVG